MPPIWLGLLVIGVVAAATWMTVWSRADTWARPTAVVLFIAAIPIVAWAGAETLGRARPLAIEWHLEGDKKYHVLAAKMVQDRAIYLYLDTGEHEPLSLRIPWDNQTATQIQQALDGAPEGREGQMTMVYDPDGQETDAQFHALPHPPSPPAKDEPEAGITYVPEGD